MASLYCGSQHLTRQAFLSSFSIIYMFAFCSLYFQIPGLYGRNGLLPAHLKLNQGRKQDVWQSFKEKHTLLWFVPLVGLDTSTAMEAICLLGTTLSFLTAITRTLRNGVIFALLWWLYFSLYQVGQTFLWFQWDILLLETGFIAIVVANFGPGSKETNTCDSLGLWLLKWLLFRLMFASGVVKLNSRCPTWWQLTALNYHYESQCIPTPLAWYANQLPDWFQRLSVALTYVIEIGIPLLFFAPCRWLRLFSFYSQVFFQILIIVTGNYNFFNLLTIVLCFSLLDDDYFGCVISTIRNPDSEGLKQKVGFASKLKAIIKNLLKIIVILYSMLAIVHYTIKYFSLKVDDKDVIFSRIAFSLRDFNVFLKKTVPLSIGIGALSLTVEIIKAFVRLFGQPSLYGKLRSTLSTVIFSGAAVWLFCISLVPYTDIEHETQQRLWSITFKWHARVDHLQITNAYGLFRSMTGVGGRPELIVEGSDALDGPWKEYEFLYKPGKVNKAPPVCTPHQPRLDWQMWFAALGSYQHNPWFINLIDKLLEGEKDVLALLGKNPFPDKPPKFVRSTLYKYHFTNLPKNVTSVLDGLKKAKFIRKWWWRNEPQEYTPPLDRGNKNVKEFLDYYKLVVKEDDQNTSEESLSIFVLFLRTHLHQLDPTLTMLTLAFVAAIVLFQKSN